MEQGKVCGEHVFLPRISWSDPAILLYIFKEGINELEVFGGL